jgi:hypothetical protein
MPLLSNMELRGMKIGALQKARDAVKTVLRERGRGRVGKL